MNPAYVYFSLPGNNGLSICENKLIKSISNRAKKCRLNYHIVDSISRWGNLNQEWLQIACTVDSSWSWLSIQEFDKKFNKEIISNLENGSLLMMIKDRPPKPSSV